jgi:ATP-dependent helicase/nuclease subunit B
LTRIPTYIKECFERGGTVIVPTRQRAHAVRLAYAAQQLGAGRRAWASPDVLPLEAWLTRAIERHVASSAAPVRLPRLLSSAEEWLLWRESAAECLGAREVLDPGALAEALRGASALALRLGIDPLRLGPGHGSEPALLGAAQRAFERRCRDLGAAPPAALLGGLPALGGSRPLLFAGFLAGTPQIEALRQACARSGPESAPAPAGPRASTVARVFEAADEIEELEAIAEWCRERLSADGAARVLVMLPGSQGRRERLATLVGQALDPAGWLAAGESLEPAPAVLLEGAGPLSALPAVAQALEGLRLLCGTSLDFEALSQWLRSPYCAAAAAAGRARIDQLLRERRAIRLDLGALLGALRSLDPTLAPAARTLGECLESAARELAAASASPRQWSERFRAALAALGWPGERRGSAEQQILVRFSELLHEFGQLSLAERALPRATALAWLAELASSTAWRPADADAPVTIAGALADPVVHYDGIWVAGLEAEALPEPARPDPFLPLPAQRAAAYPAATAAGRLGEARALLASWGAAADVLVLSAPRRVGDLETLPSALLEGWPRLREQRPEGSPGRLWLPVRVARSGLLESCEAARGMPWDPAQALPGGTRSLELQNQCPFRAYAELRLGSAPLGAPEPGIAADFRGRLLHGTLERLWRSLGDSTALAALAPRELEARIERAVTDAACALLADDPAEALTASMMRERERTARLVRSLCELESARPPFRIEHTERRLPLSLGGLALNVRIDRVDALEAGGRAILDYKSGRPGAADWYGERPSHPQLLAYLAAIAEEVVALATVSVTAREVRFEGVAARSGMLPKVRAVEPLGAVAGESAWAARVGLWRELVARLAREFSQGAAAVDPRPGACDYCHVAPICRVGDAVVPPETHGEGDADE